jgi:hypothetical protein
MKHRHHEIFISAIHNKQKVQVAFFSKKDEGIVTRMCAPFDFGPKAREKAQINRYHFWDYSSPSGAHTESLEASQIQSISLAEESFEPSEIVKWVANWHVARNWGQHS